MASTNNQNSAPDSWDADMNEEQVDDKLSKPLSSLNINAPAFVPGQNPYAPTFVPSGVPEETGWEENGKGTVPILKLVHFSDKYFRISIIRALQILQSDVQDSSKRALGHLTVYKSFVPDNSYFDSRKSLITAQINNSLA